MIKGNVWKYGNQIDTEAIYPAQYLVHFEPVEVKKHVMEGIEDNFLAKITPGDILVGGEDFGCGSAREQAAMALKYAEVGAVVADSIARTFYRNAINNGLPVVELKGISKKVSEGDQMEIDLEKGILFNRTSGEQWKIQPQAGIILDILKAGGAIPYYLNKMGGVKK